MSGQLDNFSSGSRNAKNAAGITRKDIINKTFTNVRDKFGCSGTKPAANLEHGSGRKVSWYTHIRHRRETIHVPVYEKGGDGCAADYAMAYIAGFNNGVNEWPPLRNHMWFLLTERKFLEEEDNAWNNYQQN